MSYDKVSLSVDVTEKWHTLPDSVSRYRISPRNLEVDRSRVRKLIEDALAAVEQEVDASKYSFTVLFMAAGIEDYGMIGLCGYPGMLGWSADAALRTRRGQAVKGGVAIFCYQAHLGTLFHDIAHILGGVQGGRRMVPCLYDHDLQAKPGPPRETAIAAMINLGFWDPMSCHFYQRGQPPPGLCSWTRMRLNWLDRSKIKAIKPNQTTEVTLGPLEDGAAETLVVKIPLSDSTYYLVENRQPMGCDKVLPRHGVLILYADDRIAECRQGRAPVKLINADPSIAHLEGAAFDVGKHDSYKDASNRLHIQLLEKVGKSYRIRFQPLSR
jgi:M6 family metalloprotease-like protein